MGHDPGVHTCRMEENPPRYSHTKYEKFLISGCRVISYQKNFKIKLGYRITCGRWKGRTDGRTDERTNRTDENYICSGYKNTKLRTQLCKIKTRQYQKIFTMWLSNTNICKPAEKNKSCLYIKDFPESQFTIVVRMVAGSCFTVLLCRSDIKKLFGSQIRQVSVLKGDN